MNGGDGDRQHGSLKGFIIMASNQECQDRRSTLMLKPLASNKNDNSHLPVGVIYYSLWKPKNICHLTLFKEENSRVFFLLMWTSHFINKETKHPKKKTNYTDAISTKTKEPL